MEKEVKEIVIRQNTAILFPKGEENGDILILGNFNGVCGDVVWHGIDNCSFEDNNFFKFQDTFLNNIEVLLNTLRAGNRIFIVASKDTIDYFKRLLYTIADTFMDDMSPKARKKMFNKQVWTIDTTELYERTYVKYNSTSDYRKEQAQRKIDEIVTNKIFEKIQNMKFDYIIQNPPYNKSLHLDFLEKGLDLLTEKGRMVIIEPATWLINIRKNGKGKRYDAIKKRIEGHVERVVIENQNKDFGTSMQVPFATTTIDMSKTFDTVELVCCGERYVVKSIYDCNLVGNCAILASILEKIGNFGDMMESHLFDEAQNYPEGTNYVGIAEIYPTVISARARGGDTVNGDEWYEKHSFGTYYKGYSYTAFHTGYEIGTEKCRTFGQGYGAVKAKRFSDKLAVQLHGTKEELENWKHFIFNNKLPLFLNIVLTIDQHNNSKPYLPWLVDKQYTDEEINKLFGFTDEEIKLINRTIEKYERNSPWFKRYMCGPDSVSDEEVQNFIEKLNEKYA